MDIKSISAPEYGISVFYDPNFNRARKPINRSQSWIRPKVPSFKSTLRRLIHCESVAEESYVHFLECNRQVSDYCEQPALIKYVLDGQIKKHYPDFLILKASKLTFVEIKKSITDTTPEVLRRTELLKKILPKIGYAYELIVMSEIDPVVFSNYKIVYETARSKIKASCDSKIFTTKAEFMWKELDLSEQAQIAMLILRGLFEIDWSIPVSANSIISKVNKGDSKWAC